jgi:hypothetical protein
MQPINCNERRGVATTVLNFCVIVVCKANVCVGVGSRGIYMVYRQ